MTAFPQLRFGQKARLKNRRDFEGVRQRGERQVCGCLVGNWAMLSAGSTSRLGVVTAKKLGNAVVRTRARRLLRESFRQHQHELAGPLDLVLVARASIVGKRFAEVERDFLTMLRKSRLLK
jgi:ribonuclease P protein component